MGIASFTKIVGMAIVTAWFICQQVYGTNALDLLDLKYAASVPSQNLH
jgi:hypothetical protein